MLVARKLAKLKTTDGSRSLSKSKSPGMTPQPDVKIERSALAESAVTNEQAKRKAEEAGDGEEGETKRVKVELEADVADSKAGGNGVTNGAAALAEMNGAVGLMNDGDAIKVEDAL
jgi:hypothetical protein